MAVRTEQTNHFWSIVGRIAIHMIKFEGHRLTQPTFAAAQLAPVTTPANEIILQRLPVRYPSCLNVSVPLVPSTKVALLAVPRAADEASLHSSSVVPDLTVDPDCGTGMITKVVVSRPVWYRGLTPPTAFWIGIVEVQPLLGGLLYACLGADIPKPTGL